MKRKIVYILGGFVLICVLLLYLNRLDCIYKIYDYGNHKVYFCIQKIQEDRRSVFEKLPVYEIHLDSLVNFESAPSTAFYYQNILMRRDSAYSWKIVKDKDVSEYGEVSSIYNGYFITRYYMRELTRDDEIQVAKTENFIRNELSTK